MEQQRKSTLTKLIRIPLYMAADSFECKLGSGDSIPKIDKFFDERAAYRENRKRDKAYDLVHKEATQEDFVRNFARGFDSYVTDVESFRHFAERLILFPGNKQEFESGYQVETEIVKLPEEVNDKSISLTTHRLDLFMDYVMTHKLDDIKHGKPVYSMYIDVKASPNWPIIEQVVNHSANRDKLLFRQVDERGKDIKHDNHPTFKVHFNGVKYRTGVLNSKWVQDQQLYALVNTIPIDGGVKGLPLRLVE